MIITLLPNIFDKYEITIIDSGQMALTDHTIVSCCDMNNDGVSEKVFSYEYKGKHSLQVLTNDGGIIDQWNTKEIIAGNGERFVCGDYDMDGFKEVYTFFERNDSIFLYVFEPMDTISPIFINDKLLHALNSQNTEKEYFIFNTKFEDINGDGNKELFFVINSGKSKFPRNLFIYDIAVDSIFVSDDYGSTLQYKASLFDINNDGKLEICGGLKAVGQIHDSLGYDFSDYSAWLMVFDHNLDLLFQPIEFPGFTSELEVIPINFNNQKLYACLYNHTGPLNNYPKIFLVNSKGEIVKEKIFPKSSKIDRWLDVETRKDEVFFNIIEENGLITILNESLEIIKSLKLDFSIGEDFLKADLDDDGLKEYVFTDSNDDIFITQNNFYNPVRVSANIGLINSILLSRNGKKKLSLFVNNGIDFWEFKYSKNPIASLRFLIYVGIFLVIWLFIIVIQKLQLIQLQKKERIRNQIVNLQLKSFNNQMDPHFTFNVFNTMAYKIQKESPESYASFMEFSNLIRKTLLSSDSITRTIEDDLSHLKSYLELEKLRFLDKVSYSVFVEKDIDQKMHIPKMILQTYVENAIKHGIKHKAGNGTITIQIKKKIKNMLFEIIDDGIGRVKAKELATNGTGFGLKIMENYFRLFNQYNVSKIKHNIIDLYDKQNNPIGTKVIILIPLNFSYKLKKTWVIKT